jgi:uncharacterized protein
VDKGSQEKLITSILLLVIGSIGLACLAAPLVYSALSFGLDEVPWPYSRVFNRVALLFTLVLFVLLRRSLGAARLVAAWRRETWRQRAGRAAIGCAAALAFALSVLPILVAGGEVRWSPTPLFTQILRVARDLPGALLVSLLEESFFRVMVFGGLALRLPVVWAATISSLFYAWAHFLTPRHDFVFAGWSPSVGFEYFALVLQAFSDIRILLAFVGLFVIGLALCWIYHRQRSLALCVGLHAGWFLAAKAGVHLFQFTPQAEAAAAAGKRTFLVGQPLTWAAVALAAMLVQVAAARWMARADRTESRAPRKSNFFLLAS